MINFAFSFISGIAAFRFIPFFPVTIIALFIGIVVLLFLSRHADKKRNLLFVGVVLFGLFYGFLRQDNIPELRLPDKGAVIEGTISGVPEMAEEKLRFTLDELVIEGEKVLGSVRLVILPGLFGDNFNEAMFDPGSRVRVVAKLREPNVLRNPGLYTHDMKRAGIVAVGYARQMQFIDRGSGLLAEIHKKRRQLGRIIDNSLSAENAAFHKAIIPGLRAGIGQDLTEAFSSTGLAHILSISGTHFGLLAFILFTLARLAIKCLPGRYLSRMTLYITPTQAAILLTMPVLVIYAVLSGLSTPTVRSFIMISIYMLATFIGRKNQWLNSLSIAAVIILLWEPDTLFELSFLLSFSAVLFIGYVVEKRESPAPGATEAPLKKGGVSVPALIETVKTGALMTVEKIKTGLLITAAAVLGTAPFVLMYFKQLSLISPITNLVVTPLVCFVVLPLGLVASFSALLFDMPSMSFGGLIDWVTGFALNLIRGFSHVPYATVHLHNPSFAIIIFYFLSLLFLVKGKSKRRFAPLLLVVTIYFITPYLSENNLSVTFLDAGQGDAAVVELPDKKVMLIDGSTNEPDMGRRVMAPYLWARGIRQIDYMVVSHFHPDHYGGLMYIMDNFNIKELWVNGRMAFESADFFRRAIEKKIPYKALSRGQMLESEGYRIYVFHPYDGYYAGSPRGDYSNQNSDSLVLKIETDDASMLFTGDIEEEAEENLRYLGRRLQSDIIKVPHHGGRTSSSENFINIISPQIAVISAGRNNSFGHPHRETLERYKRAGTKVFRTDKDGAVRITSVERNYKIEKAEDLSFKKAAGWKDEIRNLKLLFN